MTLVVVASSCRLLGSCVGSLFKPNGVTGVGGLCACSRLAHPSGISDAGGVGVALGDAMPFDYDDDPHAAVRVSMMPFDLSR